jgi:hypothetical protein
MIPTSSRRLKRATPSLRLLSVSLSFSKYPKLLIIITNSLGEAYYLKTGMSDNYEKAFY